MSYLKTLLLTFCFIFTAAIHAESTDLAPELEVFQPYLGTWQANFYIADNKTEIQDVGHWERALNGKAIRTTHSINEGEYGGESMIFWDSKKKLLVFYYFTTAGFYTQGTMKVLSPTQFVAYETVTGSKEGITKVKSSSDFKDNQFVVSTSYLKKGEWTKPEKRIYTRSNKQVIFK
ncbi:hypothetical protein [Pseudoalteromonas ostreae]|uniref:hypothetical protein n=1 Tax=Pseudoalteromonas ostreae TaxID=2774154 RepID=UPI001B39003B|nr:hypothetical protein [Pseudoalteromonas ostreae]